MATIENVCCANSKDWQRMDKNKMYFILTLIDLEC